MAVLCVALTLVGYLYSTSGGIDWMVATNRFLAVFAIAISAVFLILAKRAAEARSESETRYAQILDTAVSGVISIDENGIVSTFNRAAEDIFGHQAPDMIGRNVKMLMPESFSRNHDGFVANYLITGEARIIGIGREVEGLRKDGTVFPMDLGISELTAGGRRMFTGTVTDISERKGWEADLVAAKEEAEAANAAKSDFLSSMSHELRTPLNAIMGFTQLLQMDTDHPLTVNQVESTKHILQSGDHLLKLIDEVLELAQIEAGRIAVHVETLDPAPIIDSCATIGRNLAQLSGLTFYDKTRDWILPEIDIDPTRFRQVLLNLLSNAVKYNREGGTVSLSVGEGKNGAFRVIVADSGIGIARENQDHIFTPFSRLGLENSDITGTGIGLTITKELVEAMGGGIGFESALDLGSTFWVEFPVTTGKLEVMTRKVRASTDSAAEADHTILCVEDDPGSLKLLESLIGRIPNTTVIAAHTGEIGVDMAEFYRPDLVLMDINLPGMNGLEALSRLKTSPATKDIPVIALTARASHHDRKKGLDEGFAAYLTKPIDVEEVTNAIKDHLGAAPAAAAES